VVIERVRRLEDVPRLDAAAITHLMRKGVPDEVLLELARRRNIVEPCGIPERKVDVVAALDHPSIRRVLRQLDGGVATDEILLRVRSDPNVPVLDARAIVKLTGKGVPARLLVELVRKQEVRKGCDPVRAELLAAAEDVEAHEARTDGHSRPAPTLDRQKDVSPALTDGATAAAAARPRARHRDAPAPDPGGMGRIRVVAKSSLPVTYLEVLLDGDSVMRKGQIQEGEAEPGWILPPPPVLGIKRGVVVYESELPAGPHQVQAAFALSQIVGTEWDAVARARGQRYETTKAGPDAVRGEAPVCEVRAGRTCVVLVRLFKRKDGYAVAYYAERR